MESLLSMKTVPTVILDIISSFGSVQFCQGKPTKVTKITNFQYGGVGIKNITCAGGKLFIQPYIAKNTMFIFSLDCVYQYHFQTPCDFGHFIISHDQEIYTLDNALFHVDVFNLKGDLKRSWPKFQKKVDKMWKYDESHILIIFRCQLCAHVFDWNGKLLYIFGDQEQLRFENRHRHEILGNRSILIRFGDNYRLYVNEKCIRVFPITFFTNYDFVHVAISPFGEIYHFSHDKTVTVVNIFEFRDSDVRTGDNNTGKLVQTRDFRIPDNICEPFLFLSDGSLLATVNSPYIDGFAQFK